MIAAHIGADFPMIPRESALFSGVCKPASLGVVLCQATTKASTPQATWGVPWCVAPQGISVGMVGSKAIDFYALSWGIPRTPACNLIETAQRKSHPLEGSCQEAKPLPYTTFDGFFRLRCARHTPPLCGLRRTPVFLVVVSAPCAPHQSPIRLKAH